MKANRFLGKRTTYYPNRKMLNALDENNRYKSMREITSKEDALYKDSAYGPEPHKAIVDNWKEFVTKPKDK